MSPSPDAPADQPGPLRRLLAGDEYGGVRVLGTYLWPLRFLGVQNPHNPDEAVEVIASLGSESDEVLVTRMGGLFVRVPEALAGDYSSIEAEIQDWPRKTEFEDRATRRFNDVICELCLVGVVSEPASPIHIAPGWLCDGYAMVSSHGGGREIYLARSLQPTIPLLQPPLCQATWLSTPVQDPRVLADVQGLQKATALAGVAETLPTFIAGSYAFFSQRQLGEAMNDAWIVCEQILDRLWSEHVDSIANARRRERLGDTRTYTAAVRAEILFTLGVIDEATYSMLTAARQRRNDLAHRARLNDDAASECAQAMKLMIQRLLNTEVAIPFFVGRTRSW